MGRNKGVEMEDYSKESERDFSQAEKYVFGDLVGGVPKESSGYKLAGADLTIYPIKKARFAQILWENDVPAEQGTKLWQYYTKETDKAYDTARMNGKGEGKAFTRESLEALEMDSTGFHEFAKTIGIDQTLAEILFNLYDSEVRSVVETVIERQEIAEAEAQNRGEETAEPEDEEAGDGVPVYMSKQDARLELAKIMENPEDAYFNEKAPVAQRDRRIALALKLREIISGATNRLDTYETALNNEKQEALRDQYGVATPGEYSSSNGIPASRSEDDRGGAVDTPYKDADRKSASGGRIEDGGGE